MEPIEKPVTEPQLTHSRKLALLPWGLALFFAGLAMVGSQTTDVIDADASRHAMNGALIYDMVRTGHFWHPIEYARFYYAHFPAITLPYHPPMFPAIEALFYAVLGVNVFAARLAVAVAVGICAILLYRLVYATHANHILAASVVVSMMMCGTSRRVASDVMLEFPALAFMLAALLVMVPLDRPWTLGRAIAFGLLAGAAVWTKQHTVFVGALPVAWPILVGRPRLLRQKSLWVGQAVFWALVGSLVAVSAQARDAGVNQVAISSATARSALGYTLPQYGKWIVGSLEGWPGVFAACALGAFAWAIYRRERQQWHVSLYLVWTLAYCLLLIPLKAVDFRYLFFVFPAVLTVCYAFLWAGCSALAGTRRASYLVAGFAAVWFVEGLFLSPNFLRGPSQAAALVSPTPKSRILYSGDAIGSFVFAVRSRDPNLQMSVIQARRLSKEMMQPGAFTEMCDSLGIDWVVFGDHTPFDWMLENPPPTVTLEQSIPRRSTYWPNGTLHIFRVTVPRHHPGGVLEIPIPKIGGGVELKL